MTGENFLTVTQNYHGHGSQNREKQQALHGPSVILGVGLSVLCSSSSSSSRERDSYRPLVKGCGLFIRTRAAERGGTSRRGPEMVGTGWH